MKRILIIGLTILILISCSGCAPVYAVLDIFYGNDIVAEAEASPRIGFSTGILFETSEETIWEVRDLIGMTMPSAQYRSTLHFDTLTENEQTVYRALEFAMEKGYTNILVDDLLVSNVESLEKILRFLALDSPLLEQNLRYETGDFTTYYTATILDLYEREVTFDGYYITVNNFAASWWEKKQQALTKAQEIVSSLPADMTETEKAEELYRTLCKTTEYSDYSNEKATAVQSYLYDALVEGKSHCDGFANALSLLYRLAEIDCVEKMYTGTKEDEIGHTWNCFSLNGTWYNVDAVGGIHTIPAKASAMGAGYHFAFGDMLQEYVPDYAELYPACETGLFMPVDAHLADANGFYEAVKTAYKAHNKEWALIVLDTYQEKKVGSALQKIANYFRCSLNYGAFELIDNRTAVLVYDPKFFE